MSKPFITYTAQIEKLKNIKKAAFRLQYSPRQLRQLFNQFPCFSVTSR